MDNKNKWVDQPLKPHTKKWSSEVYQLKLLMEKKLKCQHLNQHRLINERWELDVTDYNRRGDVLRQPSWIDCKICNK